MKLQNEINMYNVLTRLVRPKEEVKKPIQRVINPEAIDLFSFALEGVKS